MLEAYSENGVLTVYSQNEGNRKEVFEPIAAEYFANMLFMLALYPYIAANFTHEVFPEGISEANLERFQKMATRNRQSITSVLGKLGFVERSKVDSPLDSPTRRIRTIQRYERHMTPKGNAFFRRATAWMEKFNTLQANATLPEDFPRAFSTTRDPVNDLVRFIWLLMFDQPISFQGLRDLGIADVTQKVNTFDSLVQRVQKGREVEVFLSEKGQIVAAYLLRPLWEEAQHEARFPTIIPATWSHITIE